MQQYCVLVAMLKDKEKIKRRDALKASGSAIALGSLGGLSTSPVQAFTGDTTNVGEKTFVQASLQHEGTPDYGMMHTDDFPEYLLDETESQLTLTRFVSESDVSVFENNDVVIDADEYVSPSAVTYGNQAEHLPVDGTRNLRLESSYQYPSVRFETGSDGTITVASENETKTIASGETGKLELAERTVHVRQQSEEFEEVSDPRSGGTVRTRERGPVVTETIRPVVTVRNYGTVDLYDGSEVNS